jgi:hypothetical protein
MVQSHVRLGCLHGVSQREKWPVAFMGLGLGHCLKNHKFRAVSTGCIFLIHPVPAKLIIIDFCSVHDL